MSVPQTKISEVIDVRTGGTASPGAPSSALAKTATLEVRRLTLPKGREIPTHHARGEITVHCLRGGSPSLPTGRRATWGRGQMLILATGEPHSVIGLEDSAVLVTKVLPANPPSP